MNYLKIYNEIVEQGKINSFSGDYTEKHHIIPKSLSGSNAITNLVRLSAKAHFICHLLLERIHKNNPTHHRAMSFALFLMMNGRKNIQYRTSRQYEKIRKQVAYYNTYLFKGKKNVNYKKIWVTNGVIDKLIYSNIVLIDDWKVGRSNYKINWTPALIEKRLLTMNKKYGQSYNLYFNSPKFLQERKEKHKNRPFKCVETGETFYFMIDAGKKFGVDKSQISKVLNGKLKTTAKKRFVYI